MITLRNIIIFTLLPLGFYPVYFMVTNLTDSILGDQQLINWLAFESHSLLVKIFIQDWLASLPVMYSLLLFILLPITAFIHYLKINKLLISVSSPVICSIIFIFMGFEGIGLLSNIVAVLSISIIFHLTVIVSQRKT